MLVAKSPRRPVPFVAALLPLVVVVLALIVWLLLSARGAIDSTKFPTIGEVWRGLGEEWQSGRLTTDLKISLLRIAAGFGLAALTGVPVGLWLGLQPVARAALLPVVNFFRNLSPLAWIGFAIIWFGVGDPPAVFLIFLATFFPLVLATSAAVANIPRVYFRVARDYGLRGPALLTQVTLPAILPQVVTALRVTAGLAWVVVVAAEMAGAQEGLGYAVNDARNGLRTDLLVVVMIVIGLVGVLLDRLLLQLTRLRAVRWGYHEQQR
jgi:NitT/TauT family transport system permease protein